MFCGEISMIGAIAGDMIGSSYEGRRNIKTTDFDIFSRGFKFTDDTVLTLAVADWILTATPLVEKLKSYFRRYPRAGYGKNFEAWAASENTKPYYGQGNGSAMRVSAVGFAYDRLDEVLEHAKGSAEVTHNHPEGIKGAQATAGAIFLARTGRGKGEIRDYIEATFGYRLDRPLAEIRKNYKFDATCKGSVPQAITAFLESTDFEDAVRKAISLGGDSDTIACIAGGIAQAYYGGVPEVIVRRVYESLDAHLSGVTRKFTETYGCP
jgi:ADP-ribosylglycohydrolase